MTTRERTGRERLLAISGLVLLAALLVVLVPLELVPDVPGTRDVPDEPRVAPSRASLDPARHSDSPAAPRAAPGAADARQAAACTFRVRIVTALAREPIADVAVQVHPANGAPATAVTVADGRVEVSLPHGATNVRVVPEWGAPWPSHDFAAPDGGTGASPVRNTSGGDRVGGRSGSAVA